MQADLKIPGPLKHLENTQWSSAYPGDSRPVSGNSAHKVHIIPRLRRDFKVYNNSPSSSVFTKNKTTATLERQTDASNLLLWKEDFITPVF